MKYLILLVFLAGCGNSCPSPFKGCTDPCPQTFKNYRYNDKVIVTDGFYKGQTGNIIYQSWSYKSYGCNLPSFKISLDSGPDDEALIIQDNLVLVERK